MFAWYSLPFITSLILSQIWQPAVSIHSFLSFFLSFFLSCFLSLFVCLCCAVLFSSFLFFFWHIVYLYRQVRSSQPTNFPFRGHWGDLCKGIYMSGPGAAWGLGFSEGDGEENYRLCVSGGESGIVWSHLVYVGLLCDRVDMVDGVSKTGFLRVFWVDGDFCWKTLPETNIAVTVDGSEIRRSPPGMYKTL